VTANATPDSDAPRIVFGQPSFGAEEEQLVLNTLRSGWIGQGPLVQQFEQKFAEYVSDGENPPHVRAVSSCTAALHLSLLAAGIGTGDEVITTPFTFVATINAIEHAGATPVFVDIDPDTLSITPEAVEAAITPRTRAIMPVHFAGRGLDLAGFHRLVAEYDLWLVEDAAHAVGTITQGRKVGNPVDDRTLVCFSFYPNKNLAAPEGGAIATRNAEVAERIEVLRLHGLNNDAWKRFVVDTYQPNVAIYAGYKYNWTDLQASVALPQLAKLESFLETREQVACWYDEALAGIAGIQRFTRPEPSADERHALHLYQIRVPRDLRHTLLTALRAQRIGVAVHYESAHRHPFYAARIRGSFPESDRASEDLITLPLHVQMSHADVQRVASAIEQVMATHAVPLQVH
jgi:dTDP-4-amino-4,6-dideoxygalactose transaminase